MGVYKWVCPQVHEIIGGNGGVTSGSGFCMNKLNKFYNLI